MNFLAHFYLSNFNEDLIVGNFIADSVKGKQLLQFSEEIQRGIILHRSIDNFTDNHPIVMKTKESLRLKHGKFSPVISDIIYDYFLASNWKKYSLVPLKLYSSSIYKTLGKNILIFPLDAQITFTYMVKNNWLYNYSHYAGISKALKGISKRTNYQNNMHEAPETLLENKEEYKQHFFEFFPDLINHANGIINSI
jgi:acyl carrier protein phosphodiesterase